MESVPCTVLAGEKRLPDGRCVPSRALELLGGRPMANWSLDGLLSAQMISDIYVVGLGRDALGRDDVRFVEVGSSFIENLQRGMDACPGDRVLVATADIPFISAEAADDFVRSALECGKEFCYSVVPVRLTHERYPQLRRTSVKLKDGEFTGGNLVLITKEVVRRNADLIDRIFEKRKNPFALARVLGAGFLLRLALAPRTITIDGLVRHAESIIDGTIAVIVSEYPEIATDIDKPEDLEIARRMFEDDA
jgi:GTP:adenosylcobinamide-phosphate guanylyltransferase